MMLNTGMGLLAMEVEMLLGGLGASPRNLKKMDAVGAILSHQSLE